MFGFIKNMLTETTPHHIAPINLEVNYSCGHQGRRRSMYFDMLSPSALENYLQFLETTKCADCAAVQTATEKANEISRVTGGLDEMALHPAA